MLLDTSILSTPLYTIKDVDKFLLEILSKKEKADIVNICFVDYPRYIKYIIKQNENIYTVPEVFNEIEVYSNKLDEMVRYYKNRIKRIPVTDSPYLNENREDINYYNQILEIISSYRNCIKESVSSFRYIEDFESGYEAVFDILKNTRDYRLNGPGKFYTDEHLLTTAVLTSNKDRILVNVITKDSDMLPLLRWSKNKLKDYGIDFEVGISNVIFKNGINYNVVGFS